MALTIHQVPNNIEDSSLIYPHSSNSFSMISVSSTLSSNYYDFQYHFRIYDEDGLVYETLQTPTKDGKGYLNIKNILETLTEVDFTMVDSVESTNFLKEYKVSCQEFYSNVISTSDIEAPDDHGTEEFQTKSLTANYRYNENDSIIPFQIENERWGNFFTNMQPRLNYKTGWQSTSSMYIAGSTDFVSGVEYDEIVYILKVKTLNPAHSYYGLVTKWFYTLTPLATYDFDPNDTGVTNDYETGALKIPTGILNLDETYIHREGYITPFGVWATSAAYQTGILHNIQSGIDSGYSEIVGLEIRLQSGSTYTDESDVVSDIISWEFNPCDNKEIDINWENSYGGIDYFSFNKVRSDELQSKQKTYKHNSISINSNIVHNNIGDSNIDSFQIDNRYFIEVKSDWLRLHEIDLLKGLFSSRKQVMYIDGVETPIIRITETQSISSKEYPQLIMYKFKVEYSKIIR